MDYTDVLAICATTDTTLRFHITPTTTLFCSNLCFTIDNNLYKLVSATSVVVAANMNKVVAILVAFLVFHKSLSATQMMGLCMCMTGGIAYGLLAKWEKDAAKVKARDAKHAGGNEIEKGQLEALKK